MSEFGPINATSQAFDGVAAHKLKGHKAMVTCLEAGQKEYANYLFSGSEDKTVRMWDLRTNKTVRCFIGDFFDGGIECIKLNKRANPNCILYVASTSSIVSFDLRSEKLLQTEPISICSGCIEGEINALAVHPKDECIAFADDSNTIKLLPTSRSGVITNDQSLSGYARMKTISRVHDNIISSLSFKPSNPRELLSGGFDSKAAVWDISTCRPKSSVQFSVYCASDEENSTSSAAAFGSSNRMFNPPFVQSMTYAAVAGQAVALFGLGDGTIRVLDPNDLSRCFYITPQENMHGGMVTSVYALDDHCSAFFVSGGVDGNIKGWELGFGVRAMHDTITSTAALNLDAEDRDIGDAHTQGENSTGSSVASAKNSDGGTSGSGGKSKKTASKGKNKGKSGQMPTAPTSVGATPSWSCDKIWQINHSCKINAVACHSAASAGAIGSSVINISSVSVADLTNDISIYSARA